MDLHWEGDDKQKELFAGLNSTPLAWLRKRAVLWEITIWVPGLEGPPKWAPLDKAIETTNQAVEHWFAMANTWRPAMDDASDE